VRHTGIAGVPHLSCMGTSREMLRDMLAAYRKAGVKSLVALRGDRPSGIADMGALAHANELVEFIRHETGDTFHIMVAAYPEVHPQARSAGEDLLNFKRKVEAGANGAITQYFFNIDAYLRFVDSCTKMGIDVPIVPGIMPITSSHRLAQFSSVCGAEIPRWLHYRLMDLADNREAIADFGADVVSDLCRRLLQEGAPGLHLYTLNRAKAVEQIWKRLDLPLPAPAEAEPTPLSATS